MSRQSCEISLEEFIHKPRVVRFEIDFKLPSYNEYDSLNKRNRYAAGKMKSEIEDNIMWCIKAAHVPTQTNPVRVHFIWHEQTKKRDKDNVAFAKKFILDALQKSGTIGNDNNSYVLGFTDDFVYHEGQKVIVELES